MTTYCKIDFCIKGQDWKESTKYHVLVKKARQKEKHWEELMKWLMAVIEDKVRLCFEEEEPEDSARDKTTTGGDVGGNNTKK